MVGWMTYGYRKFEQYDAQMRVLIKNLNELMQVDKSFGSWCIENDSYDW